MTRWPYIGVGEGADNFFHTMIRDFCFEFRCLKDFLFRRGHFDSPRSRYGYRYSVAKESCHVKQAMKQAMNPAISVYTFREVLAFSR